VYDSYVLTGPSRHNSLVRSAARSLSENFARGIVQIRLDDPRTYHFESRDPHARVFYGYRKVSKVTDQRLVIAAVFPMDEANPSYSTLAIQE
jgi:hypothetical protein